MIKTGGRHLPAPSLRGRAGGEATHQRNPTTPISRMRIVESQIIGKRSQETCEDGIVVTDDFVAVIDGSTSKADVRYSPDVSNGRLCMEIVSRVISEQLTPDSTITDFCRLTAEAVSAYYPQKPTKADNNLMAASAVVLNVRKREV